GRAVGMREDWYPPLDRISGDRRGGGAAAGGRYPRRPPRRLHRHQSAAGAACRHVRAVRGRARRARVERPRRAGARPDHVDEDDLYPRPLPPPGRRRAGSAAGDAVVRRDFMMAEFVTKIDLEAALDRVTLRMTVRFGVMLVASIGALAALMKLS